MTMRGRFRCAVPLAVAVAAAMAAPAAADVTAAADLRLATVGTFAAPTDVAAPPTDTRRVFVVEQGGGIRVVRDGVVVYEGKIGSLRRFKDDVAEVRAGLECGVLLADNVLRAGSWKYGDAPGDRELLLATWMACTSPPAAARYPGDT